ncbi:LLM class flavin-dependent oxidoreductase [Microbispora sp. CA-102843]|uniref:LLM class flavin-dependent oxidoreductase n=1 Tax=Microbispora sp. CA-102843 TaxID=3239952 RepID=UPI003D94C3B4
MRPWWSSGGWAVAHRDGDRQRGRRRPGGVQPRPWRRRDAPDGPRPHAGPRVQCYVERLQGYLRRETVDLEGFPSTIRSLFERDPSLDLPKPILEISATGPRVIDIAARLADGVSLSVGADVARLRQLVEQARKARAGAGLSREAFLLSCYLQVAVGTGDDLARAREYIRGAVMTQSRFSALHGKRLDGLAAEDTAIVERAVTELNQAYRTHGERWSGGGTFYPRAW